MKMEPFDQKRHSALTKKDKSNKGCIDKDIKGLCNAINKTKDHFTTSSCSGRINIVMRTSKKKTDSVILLASHSPIKSINKIKKVLDIVKPKKYVVWFKYEPAILHTCSRTVEDADILFALAKKAGYKRSGIISLKNNNVILEVMGTDKVEHLLEDDDGKYYTDDVLKKLLQHANDKMAKNLEKIKKFEDLVKEKLL